MAFNCGNCFIPTCIAGCDTRSDMENANRNGAQTTCDSRPIPKGKVIRKEYDIVCSLPLELLLEIVQYLEPAGVVGNQRVRVVQLLPRWSGFDWVDLGLQTMAVRFLIRYSHKACYAPNSCVPGIE